MVKVKEDMTGWKMWEHGIPGSKIIVLKQTDDYVKPNGAHVAQYLCECNCNDHSIFIAMGEKIRSGRVKSCGCIRKERLKKQNKYLDEVFEDEYGEYRIGFTSNTNKKFYIDVDDYDKIKDYCWSENINKNGYCSLRATAKGNRTILMAWIVAGKRFDHKDHNPLNNRKYNLRQATIQENNQNKSKCKNNTSGVMGVYQNSITGKWIAFISDCKNHIKSLGTFKNKDDAIIARLQAELQYYGEFAPQRYLFEQYKINRDRGDKS